MTSESIGGPNENQVRVEPLRHLPSGRTILQKALMMLAASAAFGVAGVLPNAGLAFGPPPLPGLPGPPPGLAGPPAGLGGPPPGLGGLPHPALGGTPYLGPGGSPHAGPTDPRGLSDLRGSPGLRGGAPGIQHDLGGRAAGGSYGTSAASTYGRAASSYGHNGWRNRYYGVYVDGNSGSGYADDGCTYTYSYRRHTRVLTCATTD
jgi:hypothetical protein